jgi:hypothetical protein
LFPPLVWIPSQIKLKDAHFSQTEGLVPADLSGEAKAGGNGGTLPSLRRTESRTQTRAKLENRNPLQKKLQKKRSKFNKLDKPAA